MPKTPEEIAAFVAEHGFPPDTAVDAMDNDTQRAAYWRNQSKVQQKKADERSDYDQLKADAEELKRVRAESATEQEKALEAAREEARREGENTGAERYLKDAVMGRFQALTKRNDEQVATTFAHVDPKSFVDDKGEIVADKLKAFADTFGTTTSGNEDPVAAALARQRAAGGGTGSSISEKRKQTRESMTKTKA